MALFKQVIPCAGTIRRDVDTDLIKTGEWYTLSGFEQKHGKIIRGPGLTGILNGAGAAVLDTVCPLAADYMQTDGDAFTIFVEKSKVYKLEYTGGYWVLTDITGAASFTLVATDFVTAFTYNNIFYMNGTTLGWYKWTGSGNIAAISGPPATIAGGSFFDHLVGVNTAADPQIFQWAAEGSETDWTPSTTNDSGAFSLTNTPGSNQMFLPIRRLGVVYKTDGIVTIQYIGGNEVFGINEVYDGVGIYNPNCVVNIDDNVHFGFGFRGPFLFDGTNVDMAFADPVRDAILGDITLGYSKYTAQVQYLRNARQVAIAYSSSILEGYVTQRLYKYDLVDKVWSGPHYQKLTRMGRGVRTMPTGTSPWGALNTPYDYMVDSARWPVKEQSGGTHYYETDMTLLAETGDIPLWVDAIDGNGQPVPLSHTDIFQIQAIHLELYINNATKTGFRFYVSTRMALDDTVSWSAAQAVTYTANGVIRIGYRATGRWVRLKFDINEDNYHELRGYKIEFTRVGRGR